MNKRNKICPFCDKLISGMSHFKNNHNDINISNEELFLLMIEKTYNCSINDIILDYENNYSLPDIKNKYNISYKVTNKILIIKNVEIRDIKKSCNENRLNKIKETSIQKYGVDNISKLYEIKEKKKITFIKNYGIDNIFKLDSFKNDIDNIMISKYGCKRVSNDEKISEIRRNFTEEQLKCMDEKSKSTNRIKYNTDYPTQNQEIKNKIKNTVEKYTKDDWNKIRNKRIENNISKYDVSHPYKLPEYRKMVSDRIKNYYLNLTNDEKIEYFKKRNLSISKLELKIVEILTNNNIQFIQQFIIQNRIFDILIKDTNILIEVNGDYWHANPNKYKETDILKFPNKEVTALQLWNKDINKEILANENNYTIIYLWECDINNAIVNNNLNDFVIQKIYEKIKNKKY